MRLIIRRASLKSMLRLTQHSLLIVAVVTLGYCGFVLVDGWMFQARESRHLDRLRETRRTRIPAPARMAAAEGLVGRIVISRLGLSVIVVEGVDKRTLRRAAGHIPGTALPGQPGNIAISAHRDTFFRPLRNIRPEDIIIFTTPLGEYRYRVVSTKVVAPADVTVLSSTGGEILTLITCHPFYFVGSAPNRFVVRAERIQNHS